MTPVVAKCARYSAASAIVSSLASFAAFSTDSTGMLAALIVFGLLPATGAALLGGGMTLFGADREFSMPILVAGIVFWIGAYLGMSFA